MSKWGKLLAAVVIGGSSIAMIAASPSADEPSERIDSSTPDSVNNGQNLDGMRLSPQSRATLRGDGGRIRSYDSLGMYEATMQPTQDTSHTARGAQSPHGAALSTRARIEQRMDGDNSKS